MLAGFDAVLMFLRINLITNWGKFCTCCCLGENFALVPGSLLHKFSGNTSDIASAILHAFRYSKDSMRVFFERLKVMLDDPLVLELNFQTRPLRHWLQNFIDVKAR